MADGFEAGLNSIPFQVTDPERIPVKRYYDEEFFRLEKERLWPHAWQMACRLEQIPNVGDYIEYSILGKSVVVVRTRDGVKAYHNACRHRGVKLAEGSGNCETSGFTCPFHGWRWNMDGKNTFVYGRSKFAEHQLDAADLELPQCKVELWGGCAFINFDLNAVSFRETMGPVLDRLEAHQVHKMRAEWWFATVLPANWKLSMEAFMEGFHVMRTHPQLYETSGAMMRARYEVERGVTVPPVNVKASTQENIREFVENMDLLSEGMGGMCHAKDVATARRLLDVEVPADPVEGFMTWYGLLNEAVTKDGRARGEATPNLNELLMSAPLEGVEFLFPHFFLLPYLTSFSSYRVRPLTPETCLFELWSLTLFPEGQEPPPVMEPTILPYNSDQFPPIPRQDYANIPRQQIGLHAEGFEFMRLAENLEGLISNYQRIIDGHLRGAPADKLAKATTLLGGNFDGPIHEFEL
jgi:phenylpropionate dioxygenase-like ring-hydroxylating dioxygenase large terminal subunit